jgi:2-oxoglutarate ferredoxin oxidoreductase subunit alpha
MFDLTVRAFNLAERFRTPVLLMTDGVVGHMKEQLTVPEKVVTEGRRRPAGPESTPFGTSDPGLVPEMPSFGEGYRLLVTGSAHRPSGNRDFSPEYHQMKIKRIREKILKAERDIADTIKIGGDNPKIAVISFGASARPSCGAVKRAIKKGKRAGYLRLRTIWPLPEREIREVADEADALIVVEMNAGKLVHEVRRVVCDQAKVISLSKVGGVIHSMDEIYEAIMREGSHH